MLRYRLFTFIRLFSIELISLLFAPKLFSLRELFDLIMSMELPRLFVSFLDVYWFLDVKGMLYSKKFSLWFYEPYNVLNWFYWRLYLWKPSYWNPLCGKLPIYFWLLLCATYLLYYSYALWEFVIFGEYFC